MTKNSKIIQLFKDAWRTSFYNEPVPFNQIEVFFRNVVRLALVPEHESIKPLFARHISQECKFSPQLLDLGSYLAKQDLLLSAYWISTLYSRAIGKTRRGKLGAFFTPPDLSKLLADEVFRVLKKEQYLYSFADICCGGGALLAPVARRLIEKMEQVGFRSVEIVEKISTCLTGIEVDPFLLFLTRTYLWAELDIHIQISGRFPNLKLYEGDALMLDLAEAPFDVIVGNPPYKTLSCEEHARLKKKFGHIMDGNSNLYPAFLERAFQLLKEKGVLSAIIPTSLYSSVNFSKLRKRITQKGHVESVLWLADRKGVFHEVLQEVSVITVGPSSKSAVGRTVVRSLEKGFESTFSIEVPARRGSGAWPLPKNPKQLEMLILAQNTPFRLVDYGYTVRVGPLVYNRDPRRRYLKFPKNGHKKGVFPIVFPFHITNGGSFKFSEKRDAKRERFVHVGNDPGAVTSRSSVVMKRTSPAGQLRLLNCGTAPDWILDEFGGYVGENHVVIFERSSDAWSVEPDTLSAVLNSDPVNLAYRCFAGTVSVSCYNLLNLPLPDPATVMAELDQGRTRNDAVMAGYRKR